MAETRWSTNARCGNCDHHTELHNIHGCTVRIQMEMGEDGRTMVSCPCGWDNLQAGDAPTEPRRNEYLLELIDILARPIQDGGEGMADNRDSPLMRLREKIAEGK